MSLVLRDPEDGAELWLDQERGAAESDLLGAVDRLTARARVAFGEALASVEAREPLPAFTTRSLEALRAFAKGADLYQGAGRGGAEASVHFEEAVRHDSTFAAAHLMLGVARGRDPESLTRAFELRDHAGRADRLLIEATYHYFVTGDEEAWVPAASALLVEDPFIPAPYTLLAIHEMTRNTTASYERAESLYEALLSRTGRLGFPGWLNLISIQLILGKDEDALRSLDGMEAELGPQVPWRHLVALNQRKWALAETLLDQYNPSHLDRRALLRQYRGRVEEARALWAEAAATALVDGNLEDFVGLSASVLWSELETDGLVPEVRAHVERFEEDVTAGGASLSPEDNLNVSILLARVGNPDAARAHLERYEATVSNRAREANAIARTEALGWTLFAEGQADRALRELRLADARPAPPNSCESCPAFAMARIHDAQARPDSAILYYEKYQGRRDYFGGEDYWLGFRLSPVLERLGQLYEARGDTALAIERYREFTEHWGEADPELQPRVEAAREALRRLGAGEAEGVRN